MGKLRKDETGFSAVELILIVVIVILIGVVGWLVYSKNHKKTSTAPAANTTAAKTSTPAKKAASTKTYTDPAAAYTVAYPLDWAVTEAPSNGLDQTPSLDSTEARFTPAGLPAGASGNTWVGISSFESGDMTTIFQQEASASGEQFSPQSLTVNGYQALYYQSVTPATAGSNGAAGGMGYTDDYYAVTHDGVTLVFYFREKQDGNGVSSSFDASSFVPAYTALVKSVKFLN